VLAVPTRVLEEGPWDPREEYDDVAPVVGLLVLGGLLTRDIVFAGRTTTELLGAGDLLRPWDDDLQFDPLPVTVTWQVHVAARMAILDTRVAMAAGRWPAIARHSGRATSAARAAWPSSARSVSSRASTTG